jgi:HPt (histidine-containing phosphotransfer) domain-containing protein
MTPSDRAGRPPEELPGGYPPIDRAHLARQTMGDVALQREVLALFAAQAEAILRDIGQWNGDTADLAHRLVGSARGIGAHAVASAAARVEHAARLGRPIGEDEMTALRQSVVAAIAYIRDQPSSVQDD